MANYMKEVAHMLGVELEEEFYIKNCGFKYKLTEKTIECYDTFIQEWCVCPSKILGLLNGENEIIKKPIIQFEGSDYDKKRKELNTLVMKKVDVKPSIITKQVFRREYEESIPITKVITSSEIITKDIIENPAPKNAIRHRNINLNFCFIRSDGSNAL